MEQKKLTSFQLILIIITVLVAGGLTVFGFMQRAAYIKNAKQFSSQSAKMVAMKGMAGFPSQETVDTLQSQLAEYRVTLEDLSKSFDVVVKEGFLNIPPGKFASNLEKATTEIKAQCDASNVKLPDAWYLGFEKYKSIPARRDATGVLMYQLEALSFIHKQLLDNNVVSLLNLHRAPTDEEEGAAKATKGKKNARRVPNTVSLPIELTFVASERSVKSFLKQLNLAKDFRFTVDTIKMKSITVEPEEAKVVVSAEEESAPITLTLDGMFDGDGSAIEYTPDTLSDEKLFSQVLGEEKVVVFLDLNLVYLPKKIEL